MILPLLLLGCMHTRPSPPWPESVAVRLESRERAVGEEGRTCRWEEESLWAGGRRLVGESPPDAEDWCREPSDHWRTIDVVAQDGPYLSLLTEDSDGRRTCGTLDLSTGSEIALSTYDEKLAARRARRAARLLAKHPAPAGFDENRFLLREGHVRFCWVDERGERHDLDVP